MEISEFSQFILDGLNTSFIILDSDNIIVKQSPAFAEWMVGGATNLVNQPLTDVLPEFLGQEEVLNDIRQGLKPVFRLENVNRHTSAGDLAYYTLSAILSPFSTAKQLVIFAIDTSDAGYYLQDLMQSHNELKLSRRLVELPYRMDHLLRNYLSSEVVETLLIEEQDVKLGGVLREITVLFADIRGFTELSEKLPPDQIVELLNAYLNLVVQAVDEFGGTINQFQGDNVVVIFNMSHNQVDHTLLATQAGLKLQELVQSYHAQQNNTIRLSFGVGINTGTALVGNIGAYKRYTYTAIGDVVNLAARITNIVPPNEVWVSEDTKKQLPDSVKLNPLPAMRFKGKAYKTLLYQVQSLEI